MKMCLNFKDAAMQLYATPMFKMIQAEAERKFCTLPAPAPTGWTEHPQVAAAPANMDHFYDQNGGCFYGGNFIQV